MKIIINYKFIVVLALLTISGFAWNLHAAEKATPEKPLFIGVHHTALYTGGNADAADLRRWYEKHFGFEFMDLPMAYVAPRPGTGGLEIMKGAEQQRSHLGILVSDLDLARKELEGKGLELEENLDVGPAVVALIKGTDPAGYKLHLIALKESP